MLIGDALRLSEVLDTLGFKSDVCPGENGSPQYAVVLPIGERRYRFWSSADLDFLVKLLHRGDDAECKDNPAQTTVFGSDEGCIGT